MDDAFLQSAAVVWSLWYPSTSCPVIVSLRYSARAEDSLSYHSWFLSLFCPEPVAELIHDSDTADITGTVPAFTIHYLLERIRVVNGQAEGTRGYSGSECVRDTYVQRSIV